MKVPQTSGGSFGLPPEAKEALAKHEEAKTRQEPTHDEEVLEEVAKAAEEDPKALLKKDLDITITEDDMYKLITTGTLTKRASVIKTGNFTLTAEVKTLTAEEMMVVDQLLAEELKNTAMTNTGYQARMSMWTLSLGIVRINNSLIPTSGIPLKNGKTLNSKDSSPADEIDFLALARAREKELKTFSGIVIDKLAQAHARFALACNVIVGNPDSPLLDRPSRVQEDLQEKN